MVNSETTATLEMLASLSQSVGGENSEQLIIINMRINYAAKIYNVIMYNSTTCITIFIEAQTWLTWDIFHCVKH